MCSAWNNRSALKTISSRDYGKCILCYKCVEACGEEAQFTFAISVAGRGFEAHIDTGNDVPLAGVANAAIAWPCVRRVR